MSRFHRLLETDRDPLWDHRCEHRHRRLPDGFPAVETLSDETVNSRPAQTPDPQPCQFKPVLFHSVKKPLGKDGQPVLQSLGRPYALGNERGSVDDPAQPLRRGGDRAVIGFEIPLQAGGFLPPDPPFEEKRELESSGLVLRDEKRALDDLGQQGAQVLLPARDLFPDQLLVLPALVLVPGDLHVNFHPVVARSRGMKYFQVREFPVPDLLQE